MEISVIGSSQDNLGMPELGNRELDFINLKDGFRISNDRVCFRKNIKWKKDGIRFTLRALQSEPVQAEKHSGVGRRSKSISFFCFDLHAGFCFWLKVGLKLHVTLCFHGSTKPNISLPNWVTRIGESQLNIYFKDQSGQHYKKYLASSSRSDSEAWLMCGVLPKKMICFTAFFECAASIHGRGSVAVNMVCCFILDRFLVVGQLLEEICGVHYFVKRIPNTVELIKTMVGQKLECNVVKILI
ncbi:hypothetical protein S83_012862 [Arachis hypogaea]